jgi:hypothetical protein
MALGQSKVNLTKRTSLSFESLPSTAKGGDRIVISIRIEGASQGYKVSANSTAFKDRTPLYDDGVDPDRKKGDSIFTGRALVRSTPGKHQIQVEVRDAGGSLEGRISRDIMVSDGNEPGPSISAFTLIGIALIVIVVIAAIGVAVVLTASASHGKPERGTAKDGKGPRTKTVEAIELN